MSFDARYISDRRSRVLAAYPHSASPLAILPTALQVAGFNIGVVISYADSQNGYGMNSGAHSFLIWLRLWFLWLSGGAVPAAQPTERNWTANRKSVRMQNCAISSVRDYTPFYSLWRRGLSRGQFMERLVALSLFGRVRVYRIYFWGNVLQRRAQLVCYDHGWWQAPLGIFGRVYCGFWPVHMWPDWQSKGSKSNIIDRSID